MINRRESGLRRISLTSQAIWSIVVPSGAAMSAIAFHRRGRISILVSPFIPDRDAVLLQVAHIGVARAGTRSIRG